MKNTLIVIVFLMLLVNVAASTETLGTFKRGDCVSLKQTCSNCTYSNITQVIYPNSSIALTTAAMTKTGTVYSLAFCNTQIIGEYIVDGVSDVDAEPTVWSYNFFVTETGDNLQQNQGQMVLAQLGMIALFLAMGFSFSKEKWKVRSLFFMAALLMGIITLNSIRVIASASTSLSQMGNTGLILGIFVLSFMFLYILIYYSVEVFKYFKEKRRMRWEVSSSYG